MLLEYSKVSYFSVEKETVAAAGVETGTVGSVKDRTDFEGGWFVEFVAGRHSMFSAGSERYSNFHPCC